jgi:Protein of unknown function (DUF1566)
MKSSPNRWALLLSMLMSACGGGSPSTPPAPKFSVGGGLTGLDAGKTLVLQNNGADDLTLTSNGRFNFASSMPQGAAYAVTVKSQPSNQTCAVTLGSGTLNAAVTNIAVQCTVKLNPLGISVTKSSTSWQGVAQTFTITAASGMDTGIGRVKLGPNDCTVRVAASSTTYKAWCTAPSAGADAYLTVFDIAGQTLKQVLVTLSDLPNTSSGFIVLDASGEPMDGDLSFYTGTTAAHPDVCVLQTKRAGMPLSPFLIWEIKRNDGGERSKSRTYTNIDDITKKQLWDGISYTYPTYNEINDPGNSQGYAQTINRQKLCGYDGWAVPGWGEMANLNGDVRYFPNTINNGYWTNKAGSREENAWYWNTLNGGTNETQRGQAGYVRLMRTGQ